MPKNENMYLVRNLAVNVNVACHEISSYSGITDSSTKAFVLVTHINKVKRYFDKITTSVQYINQKTLTFLEISMLTYILNHNLKSMLKLVKQVVTFLRNINIQHRCEFNTSQYIYAFGIYQEVYDDLIYNKQLIVYNLIKKSTLI